MKLVPKKWSDFQHYKDRCPPWIKLHRDLLNDRDFMCLPLASKALAPLLWLLASESKDGTFDASTEELSFRLRLTEQEVVSGLNPLISKGFFLDASTLLAPCLQVAIPETERETEKEIDTPRVDSKVSPPDGVSLQVWADFLKHRRAAKAPVTDTAINGFRREAAKAGMSLEQALITSIENNWRGFKAEWIKTPQTSTLMKGVL